MSNLFRSESQPKPLAGDQPFAAYVIEVGERPAGILVRDGQAFRFFAAQRDFGLLEGSLFRSPRAAQKAAERMQSAARPQSDGSAGRR
jgi:hypothetical protein